MIIMKDMKQMWNDNAKDNYEEYDTNVKPWLTIINYEGYDI
jgi:hypothetical protein